MSGRLLEKEETIHIDCHQATQYALLWPAEALGQEEKANLKRLLEHFVDPPEAVEPHNEDDDLMMIDQDAFHARTNFLEAPRHQEDRNVSLNKPPQPLAPTKTTLLSSQRWLVSTTLSSHTALSCQTQCRQCRRIISSTKRSW